MVSGNSGYRSIRAGRTVNFRQSLTNAFLHRRIAQAQLTAGLNQILLAPRRPAERIVIERKPVGRLATLDISPDLHAARHGVELRFDNFRMQKSRADHPVFQRCRQFVFGFIEPQFAHPGGRQDNLQVGVGRQQVIENRHPFKKYAAGRLEVHAPGAIVKDIAVVQDGVIVQITDIHRHVGGKSSSIL
jgi:hypothetical protein